MTLLIYSNPKLVVRVEQASSLSGQDAQLTNQVGLLYVLSKLVFKFILFNNSNERDRIT